MKKLTYLFYPIMLTLLCGCPNHQEYLNIVFNDNKLNSIFLEKYVDKVVNRDLTVPESVSYAFFKGDTIYSRERLLHFHNNPDEWYLISFDAAPCWIVYVYNLNISPEVISSRDKLGYQQLRRIEVRFRKEILDKAELYGKQKHLPDSVIYNTKY